MNHFVLKAAQKIYGLAVACKNFLYDSGLADSLQVSASVISVGNLTVGGTGKTPIIDHILFEAGSRELTAAVVSRNYKAKCRGTHRIDTQRDHGAAYFGDEPFLLALRHPNSVVYVGPKKVMTAAQVAQEVQPKLILVDDGFQHRALHRDFEVLLLDATKDFAHYELLPVGRAREAWDSIGRAHLVILTKVNLTSADHLASIQERLPAALPLALAEYQVGFPSAVLEGGRFFVFSGLADQDSFQKSLAAFKVAEFAVFADHHAYNNQDIQKLEDRARQLGCDKILTTAKDYVKVKSLKHSIDLYEVIELTIVWRIPPVSLYEFLDKIRSL